MKHRIWDKELNCWVFGNTAIDSDGDIMFGRDCREWAPVVDPDRLIIEYYIGQNDRDGVEMCEGDIVHYDNNRSKKAYRDVIKWAPFKSIAGFQVKSPMIDIFDSEILIIGNIHQNPELLE